jgi:hypothetical protein
MTLTRRSAINALPNPDNSEFMDSSVASIDTLLHQFRARRHGDPGNTVESRERLDTSKFLASNYLHYDRLRLHLVSRAQYQNISREHEHVKNIAAHLTRLGWIEPIDDAKVKYRFSPNVSMAIRDYLCGHWLEEYVYEAFVASGADEGYYGQKIIWGKDIPSFFEMDVIARKASQLVFVSCKAISPGPVQGMSTELRRYMSEALTWDQLFSGGDAKVMIVTTADMIDERSGNKVRYSQLNEQANGLNQILIGIEQLKWPTLIECCKSCLT